METNNGFPFWCREGKKKQNLKCVRFDVGGECRVLLVSNRDIAKGERLYYDYNGDEHEYPTEHFVWLPSEVSKASQTRGEL